MSLSVLTEQNLVNMEISYIHLRKRTFFSIWEYVSTEAKNKVVAKQPAAAVFILLPRILTNFGNSVNCKQMANFKTFPPDRSIIEVLR